MSSVAIDDDVIGFTTTCRLDMPEEILGAHEFCHFITAHGMRVYEWRLNMVIYNFDADYPSKLYLVPIRGDWMEDIQKFFECRFRVDIKNMDGAVIRTDEFIDTHSDGGYFKVPPDSPLGQVFHEIVWPVAEDEEGSECIISILLFAKTSTFDMGDWSDYTMALPYTGIADFMHRSITDESQHDFRLLSADGQSYQVSRTLLYVGSIHFRDIFHDDPTLTEYAVQQSLLAVKTLIIFTVTETFLPPPKLTPKLTEKIIEFSKLVRPMSMEELSDSLMKLATEQLEKVKHDLDAVVSWLVAAISSDLPRLANAAFAIMLTEHYSDYLIIYSQPNMNPLRMELHRKMTDGGTDRDLRRMHRQSRSVFTILYDCEPRK